MRGGYWEHCLIGYTYNNDNKWNKIFCWKKIKTIGSYKLLLSEMGGIYSKTKNS